MAIRRPSIYSPTWVYQDFLYLDSPPEQLRYVLVKWDGAIYSKISQTFDYSNPPYSDSEQRGGSIVARLDYTVNDKLVTIDSWEVNWRDEFPLRLGVNYIRECLYPTVRGYVILVAGDEVYNQAGEAIQIANRDPYAFWVSEQYFPVTNKPNDYLLH